MKKFYNFIFCLFGLLLFSAQVSANKVYVKGLITSLNGAPVVNQKVTISVAATGGSNACTVANQVTTNPNGYYYDSLACSNADITKVQISTIDCNTQTVSHIETVPAGKVVESNFSICYNPPSTHCEAAYTLVKGANPLEVKFYSSTSHGNTTTDNIVKRRWTFGDGSILEGNEVSPTHVYTVVGTYEVCLTITTSTGCENKICQNITLAETTCKAKFTTTLSSNTSIGSATIKFNSSTSISATNITQRIWKFGDGSELTGNVVDPTHTYTKPGTYTACLTIRTAGGCTSDSCMVVQVLAPVATCKANVTATTSGKTVKFGSINSQTTQGNIISRTWDFGDGKTLTGNVIDPSHQYGTTGTYTACLTIKSSTGCESRECTQVVVAEKATACTPQFSVEKLSAKKVSFNSANSTPAANDSIVQRTWDFGDGTAVLTGNQVSASKEYIRAGIYTVCLRIKTRSGCENQYCTTVTIGDNTPPAGTNDFIKIVSLHPNPATSPVSTEVWSANNNINAELSIYDIYGVKKWSITKVLQQGTNVNVIPTSTLAPGPYFFRVTTMYGVQSKQFYKL